MTFLKCNKEVALAWRVNAKNSLINCIDFSSAQLVFDCNPNLSNNMNNVLPALEAPID